MKKSKQPPKGTKATEPPKPPEDEGLKHGRPTLLNPAVHEAIIANIRLGMSEGMAGEAEGVDKTTLSKWKKRGKAEGKGVYFNFFNDLQQARPKFVKSNLAIIHKARNKDWRAAAWLLSKTEDRFADKSKIKVGGDPEGLPIPMQDAGKMSDDERINRARAARAILDTMDADEAA